MAAVAPGWFRLKLGRPLTDEETDALYALAGPLYQPWGRAVVVHENAAWMTERFLTAGGVPFRYAAKAATPAPLSHLPELEGLRSWVPDFLTPYQRQGLLDFGNRDGVFAILPTGAGKTLFGAVYGLLRPGPILIVTRAGARRTIATDIRRYTEFEPFIIESTQRHDVPPNTRFIVVGWETLVHHVPAIMRAGPVTAIFDESHLAKSHKRYEAVIERNEVTQEPVVVADEGGGVKEKIKYRKLRNRFAAAEEISRSVQWRMNLTATPIRDRIRDLWAQLDLLHPKGWGGFYRWCARYADAHQSQWGGIDTRGRSAEHLVNELMLRMSFSSYYVPHSVTHRELPAKRRQVTYIQPDELSTGKDVMKEMREHGFRSATGEAWAKLALAAAMKRRRVIDEAISGAFKAPDGREGGKVVVLTGLRADAERIAAELRKPSTWGFGRGGAKEPPQVWMGHGGDSPQARDVIREAYMAHPGPCILVGTSDAWGESINLHDTDLAIIAMLPFTPGQVRQVEGRFARLGQLRPVLLLYLIAEGTYDEHVATALLSKLPAVEKIAQDEVIGDFGKDLKGDEEAIAAALLSKLTAAEAEDDDGTEDDEDDEAAREEAGG